MKKIVEYKDGSTDYNVGDVVFLHFNHKAMKPTCRAIAIKEDNGCWLFKPLSRQSYYLTRDGLIPFGCKPWIFAKESEEEQP